METFSYSVTKLRDLNGGCLNVSMKAILYYDLKNVNTIIIIHPGQMSIAERREKSPNTDGRARKTFFVCFLSSMANSNAHVGIMMD